MSQSNMLDDAESKPESVEQFGSSFYLPLKMEANSLDTNTESTPDDSDSGILVNESGQSSIVDVHEEDRLQISTNDTDLNEYVATSFK